MESYLYRLNWYDTIIHGYVQKIKKKVNVQYWTSVQIPSLSNGVEIPSSGEQLHFIECCP
jgi:hypothetical protein